MLIRRSISILLSLIFFSLIVSTSAHSPTDDYAVYLPIISKPVEPMVEFRGLWVTRYDWTVYNQPAQSSKLDEIVQNAADAGFNAIFFQVRGTADAYYASSIEPWAQRVSGGSLGQAPDPYWDPLAYFVEKAHAAGMELHAYMNIYPVWGCSDLPDPNARPLHFYYLLKNAHGTTNGDLNGSVWDSGGAYCSGYLRATPASGFADDHYLSVAADIVNRYDVDGIHLDYIRYPAKESSCDPISEAVYGAACFADSGYTDWQRAQINGTVYKFYQQLTAADPDLMLSAAVWFNYVDGYHKYYQNPREWLNDNDNLGDGKGYIDTVLQMIYPSSSFSLAYWEAEVADMQKYGNGRFIFPGIGSEYNCTDCGSDVHWQRILARIERSRELGTGGHSIFSYNGLLINGFFDDLAAGPYAVPATVPEVTWH